MAEDCKKDAKSRGYCKYHYVKFVVRADRTKVSRGNGLYAIWHNRKIRDAFVPEWNIFKNFCADVGDRPSEFHYLSRLHAGPYGPDNFEWKPHLKRQEGESKKDWYARKWQARKAAHPGWDENRRIGKRYGITREQYDERFATQNGLCAICEKPETDIDHKTGLTRRLAIDHCHKTGKVRELLCRRCNHMLGNLEENLKLVRAIETYIQRHNNGRLC